MTYFQVWKLKTLALLWFGTCVVESSYTIEVPFLDAPKMFIEFLSLPIVKQQPPWQFHSYAYVTVT